MRQRPRDNDDYDDDDGSEGDGVEGGGWREGTVDGDGDWNGNYGKAEAARLRRRAEELRAEVHELETRMDDN